MFEDIDISEIKFLWKLFAFWTNLFVIDKDNVNEIGHTFYLVPCCHVQNC